MEILMIGNSYSMDAARYLHRIARADGVKINTTELYISGCTLERHFRNMHSGAPAYELYVNGEGSGFHVTLEEAVLNRPWDIITYQQASHQSMKYDTYQPYLQELMDFTRTLCPKAKHIIHQVWADAPGSKRLPDFGYEDNIQMFRDMEKAYDTAYAKSGADSIVRSGELICALEAAGLTPVRRDHGHLSLGLGRFAAGLLWYRCLTDNDIMKNSYSDLDEPVSPEEIAKIKEIVCKIG